MGNQERHSKPAGRILNVSEEANRFSVTSPNHKSFRVSFGKTVSLAGIAEKEKPRFEIVPNDTICIVEVPRKKHISPQRRFDIITNEPKTTNIIIPESSDHIPDNRSKSSEKSVTPTSRKKKNL